MKHYGIPMFILFLTVFLVAFCIYTNLALERAAASFLKEVDILGQRLEAGSWEEGQSLCQALDERWQKEQRLWAMLVDHQELDRVTENLLTLKNRIISQDFPEAALQLELLQQQLEHIPAKERLTWANLF